MDNKPKLTTLTLIAFNLNSAIEAGHGNGVSFDEIYSFLEKDTLLEELNNNFPNVFDFSLFPSGSNQAVGFNQTINNTAGGFKGRETRKLGIRNNGLSLLLGFIIEAIQQGDWAAK